MTKNVTFGFKSHFEPLILNGTKCATIRKTRRADVGDIGMGYIGWRTPNCRKFCTFEIVSVYEAELQDAEARWDPLGFQSKSEAMAFYERHKTFEGCAYMYIWRNAQPIEPQNKALL